MIQAILLAVSGAAIIGGIAFMYQGVKSEAYKNGHLDATHQMQVSLDNIRKLRDKREDDLRQRVASLDKRGAEIRYVQVIKTEQQRSVVREYIRADPVRASAECLDIDSVLIYNSFAGSGGVSTVTSPSSGLPDSVPPSSKPIPR